MPIPVFAWCRRVLPLRTVRLATTGAAALTLAALAPSAIAQPSPPAAAPAELLVIPAGSPRLLSEPFLQRPERSSVRVVWLTNFPGARHEIIFGDRHLQRRAEAQTERMQRMLEDASSRSPATDGLGLTEVVARPVWRHEAVVTGLLPNRRVPYRVRSVTEDGNVHESGVYTLQPLPTRGQPLKILLTSDQQNRHGFPAAMQKVEQLFGPLEAVLFAGDYVDNPRQASEWFDRFDPAWRNTPGSPGTRPFPSTRPAFFPSMQGTFDLVFPEFPWRGSAILQYAPKFGAIGNHEQPGRHRPNARIAVNNGSVTATIGFMDNDPQPRWYAEMRYEDLKDEVNPSGDPALRAQWIRDQSHDWEVHRQMWTHPEGPEGEQYYVQRFGDVAVAVMNVSRVWRTFNVRPQDRGKFTEFVTENRNPGEWGFGDFHFFRFDRDSDQFRWLSETLQSPLFRRANYRIVVAHHTVAGLGHNALPVHADNVMHLDYTDAAGAPQTRVVRMPTDAAGRAAVFRAEVLPMLDRATRVRYEYPVSKDIWKHDVEPLLVKAGVHLVHVGHSHVYSRVVGRDAPGLTYLETSSAGNTFGAFWTQADGTPWKGRLRGGESALFAADSPWDTSNCARTDDPFGREPMFPTLANPMHLWAGEPQPVPFVTSDDISTFTILDTGMGAVRSFAIDLRDPQAEAIEFDRFFLDTLRGPRR